MSSTQVGTYDLNKIEINVNGLPASGFGDGDALKITPEEADWGHKNGADGGHMRSRTNNRTRTGSMTLLYTSAFNKTLNDLRKADALTGAGRWVFAWKDVLGLSFGHSPSAYIDGPPELVHGKEGPSLEWPLVFPNYEGDEAGQLAGL